MTNETNVLPDRSRVEGGLLRDKRDARSEARDVELIQRDAVESDRTGERVVESRGELHHEIERGSASKKRR
jgi:hypothetical protein